MAKQYQDRFFSVRLSKDEKKVKIALLGITLLLLLLLANMFYLTIQSIKKETPVLPAALPLEKPSPSPSPTAPPSPIVTSQPEVQSTGLPPAVKEYFVAFGGGTNQTDDWVDVPGATAEIDFGKYSHIKEVHFEASVVIPTGNETASVRLFNETDKHPVWYSEITLTNGQFVSSNPIIYDVGQKLYQVQMKTSLKFLATLVQSRVHIILQ